MGRTVSAGWDRMVRGCVEAVSGMRRRLSAALLILATALMMQACGGADLPFSKTSRPSGKTAPAITVNRMDGLPSDKAGMMVKFLAEAAAKRDLPIVDQDFPDSWKLTGDFMPRTEPDGTVTVVYGWTLWDANQQNIHQVSGVEAAGPASGDPWVSVTPDLLRRIAGFTTESISSRLAQLGYATQIGGLLPPTRAFVRAGPGAEQDIDYETLYGPQVAVADTEGRSTGLDTVPAAAINETAPVRDEDQQSPRVTVGAKREAERPAQKAERPTKDAKDSGKAVRAVALTGVEGAPGDGNRELAVAMRKVLTRAGWPVVSQPRDDALTISGDVEVGPKSGSVQKVALAWSVSSPDGKLLGTIKQANNVPAGSLDGAWGKTADYAAQAGAEGIFKLVQKYR